MNANIEQFEALLNHVMGSEVYGNMHDKGYSDAFNEKVKRPAHNDTAYRKGWALGLEFKGK